MRALVAGVLIDVGDADETRRQMAESIRWLEDVGAYGGRVGFALGPHAVYTVRENTLRWVADTSRDRDVLVHMHLSETTSEVEACIREHGCRPVEYLYRLGLLTHRLVAAHAVHVDDGEIARLAECEVTVVHNPASNCKLASGGPMPYRALAAAGVNVVLGTDGAASNNNLDLFEEMKIAALLAKHASLDATALPARDALLLATANAARAFRLGAGALEPGCLADLVLVDLNSPFLFPGRDLAADLVYSACGRAVVTTVCDGQVLMERGLIDDEADIRREVRARLTRLID
jgi:5-methylthioadenosine/S-adenosylhomocysteine deaminase